jgi:hypothetical protein
MTVLDEQQEQAQAGAAPPEPEAPPREKREYVVLVRESAKTRADVVNDLRAHAELLDPDGQGEVIEGVLRHAEDMERLDRPWGELGRVAAFNRTGAMEEVERLWPAALEGDDVGVHLIPLRFWTEITPEAAPPPPPRRRWKGV